MLAKRINTLDLETGLSRVGVRFGMGEPFDQKSVKLSKVASDDGRSRSQRASSMKPISSIELGIKLHRNSVLPHTTS